MTEPTVAQPLNLLHYNIIETLGEGGNGTVYRAINSHTTEVVALKTLKNVNEMTLNRFKREYLALKRLDNPGIIKVFDAYFSHEPPFFSMEWVKGKTLSKFIQDMENNPMVFTVSDRENFAIRMGIQVCDILTYIHGFEEVHRDLKPDNLFVTMMEKGSLQDDFEVKMLDFGLLKQVSENREDSEATQGGMIVGTVNYLSPEQAKGTNLDPRADLYSLGVIIYKIISLKLPFEADDVVGYIFKTVFEEPIPIENRTPETSSKMREILADLLAKDPSKRPPSASALRRRLKALISEEVTLSDIDAEDLNFTMTVEGFGSPLLPAPLTGREEAVRQLEIIAASMHTKHPQALILHAEAGMGRTSVLKEWIGRVKFEAGAVLQLQFSHEIVPAQDPVGMLMDSLIKVLKPSEIKTLFGDIYPFLTGISRYLGRYFDTKSVGRFDHLSPGRRLQIVAVNFIKLIYRLSQKGPVIIVIDDAQYAPERFFGWLTLLWEQVGKLRVLLVISCTPDPARGPCDHFLRRLKDAKGTSQLELKPLKQEQVKELIQLMLPVGQDLPMSDKLLKFLMERTSGNPFYVIELFSRLYEENNISLNTNGALDLQNKSNIDVPLSIHQALLKKVRKLPPDELQMLRAAAIMGTSFDYPWLVACMGWPEERFLNHLHALLKLGILAEELVPVHKIYFCAPAVQKTIYEDISAREKTAWHNRIAKAIEAALKPNDILALEQVAYHYSLSANHVRALKYAYLAGNSALESKNIDKAIYFYELSLDMMEKMENKQARNLINLKLAEVHYANYNAKQALYYYNTILEMKNLSKMEELRAYRGRMLCYEQNGQLEQAYHDAKTLCNLGSSYSARIRAESLFSRGFLSWLVYGDSAAYLRDLKEAKDLYPKLKDWQARETYAMMVANQMLDAVDRIKYLLKNKFEPSFELGLQLAGIYYFMGEFKSGQKILARTQKRNPENSGGVNPQLMVAHALLTYRLNRILAPDHPSEEYLGIARRYIERFGLDELEFQILLVELENLLMNAQYQEAWVLVQEQVENKLELPPEYHSRSMFLSMAMRAAWELGEDPPRKWLRSFQQIRVDENTPFTLQTHWCLAKTVEALLPKSSGSLKDLFPHLKVLEKVLVKQKLRYYYRALLEKQIRIHGFMNHMDKAAQLEKVKVKLDDMLDSQVVGGQ